MQFETESSACDLTDTSASAMELITSIEEGVQLALESQNERAPRVAERRSRRRLPYPQPFFITPINRQSEPLLDQTISVIGHRLSPSGIDFYHQQAIPFRHVIASFPISDEQWVAFVLHLSWCRFNRFGWYDNGGRFLRMVPSPLDGLDDAAAHIGTQSSKAHQTAPGDRVADP